MTDRELLELAAKSIGKAITGWNHQRAGAEVAVLDDCNYWQPLHANGITDCDGDALRLAVKLDIQIWRRPSGVEGIHKGSVLTKPQTERLLPDPFAATRRAIVRAAAEIGRLSP